MTVVVLTGILIGLVFLDFIIDQLLEWLNIKAARPAVPEELKDIYTQEQYDKSKAYRKESGRVSLFASLLATALILLAFYLGWFGQFYDYLQDKLENEIAIALAFFGIIFLLNDILQFPFQLYDQFVIEEKYGFNKMKPTTFLGDKVKGYLLTFLIGGLLLSIFIWLVTWLGKDFWWIFWLIATLFMLFMNFFYTSLIVPLFNKLTPLEDGELKEKILEYAGSVSFPVKNIFVIDGSRRSSKANAYFSGWGRKKKVVLYDTLIEQHSTDELVAVLAHEIGHYKKRHIIIGFITGIVQTGITLYILSWFVTSEMLSQALGAESVSIPVNLVAFGVIYSPVSRLMGLLSGYISRKNEYEADYYATSTFNGESLIKALKKLSAANLSNIFPHRLYVIFHYSHPPLLRRIAAIRKNF